MEYNYSLTTSYDGELIHTLRVSDMLEAVSAWTKCVDFGDAKEYLAEVDPDIWGQEE